jgi:ATP citrate (pro-S)-lyase
MSAKAICEADGKAIINYHLTRAPVIKPSPLPRSTTHNPPPRLASLYFPEDAQVTDILDQAEVTYPWLLIPGSKFVAKPDQLIKRRGKSGLLALNKTWAEAKAWIAARAGKPQQVESVVGVLRQFLVEPFVPHPDGTEYYININSQREVSCPVFFLVFVILWVQFVLSFILPRVVVASTAISPSRGGRAGRRGTWQQWSQLKSCIPSGIVWAIYGKIGT